MSIPHAVDFMAVSSYGLAGASSGVVRILKDLDHDKRMRAMGYIRYLEAEVEWLRKDRDEWRDLARAEGADAEHERKLKAEVSRLEGLILDWYNTSFAEDVKPFVAAAELLGTEGKRIRAAKGE